MSRYSPCIVTSGQLAEGVSRYNRLYCDSGAKVWPLAVSRYSTSRGCDTATAAATIRPSRRATRRGTPATRPATRRHDTAQCVLGRGVVRAAWVHHARCNGLLGVHLSTQPSFGLSALFQSQFGPLFTNTVHGHCSRDFSKK